MEEPSKLNFTVMDGLNFDDLLAKLKKFDPKQVSDYIFYLTNQKDEIKLEKAKKILLVFDMEDISYDSCTKLLSSFKNIPLCNHFSYLLKEENQKVDIDWQYENNKKDREIQELKDKIKDLEDKILERASTTDLFNAIEEQNVEIVRKIITKNNSLLEAIVYDNYKHTPLLYASMKGYTKIVELLLELNANVEAKDEDNDTPLMMASLYGNIDVVKLLVQHKANINMTDTERDTALHLATMNSHVEVIKYLISIGANTNAIDFYGKKPINFAKTQEIRQLFDT